MESEVLQLDCEQWWDVAKDHPEEMEIITTMMVDAGEDFCGETVA